MSTRREYSQASFAEVSDAGEQKLLAREINKIKPRTEISVEGHSEVAEGKILEWDLPRKLLTVKWSKKTEAFEEMVESAAGLRAFFKVPLFTTQLVFKSTAARRLDNGTYHFRIPAQFFRQQKRGALRVPIHANAVKITCDEGSFRVLNLSVGGAKISTMNAKKLSKLHHCELNLGSRKITTPDFVATVTSRDESAVGIRFAGLNEAIQIELKQYLIEALRVHFKKEW